METLAELGWQMAGVFLATFFTAIALFYGGVFLLGLGSLAIDGVNHIRYRLNIRGYRDTHRPDRHMGGFKEDYEATTPDYGAGVDVQVTGGRFEFDDEQ